MTNHIAVPLEESHNLTTFESGVDRIDRFLANEAHRAHKRGTSRTHVWLTGVDVVAYYTVLPTAVESYKFPKRMRKGTSGSLPGFLIAKFALTRDLQGQGLGENLLVDALCSVVTAADHVGGRVIVLTAEEKRARDLYARAGFHAVERSYDMWLEVATARAAILGLYP